MYQLKACAVCLNTNVKFINLDVGQLRFEYNLISGVQSDKSGGLAQNVCIICAAYIRKFIKFRNKCQRSYYTLCEIVDKNCEISESILKELDRNKLDINPPLACLDTNTASIKYEIVKFKKVKDSRIPHESSQIQVLHYSTHCDDYEGYNKVLNKSLVAKNEVEESFDDYCTLNDDKIDLSDDNCENGIVDETKIKNDDVDGSEIKEEFARMVPISREEAAAVVEINQMYQMGDFKCETCGEGYTTEARLQSHMRMHDSSLSGTQFCDLCKFYYKTPFQLKLHMDSKHTYKYLCRECPEVSFDRVTAKSHYMLVHMPKIKKRKRRLRPVRTVPVVKKKIIRKPIDLLKCTTLTQEEQYKSVADRRHSKNYIESPLKCDLCFRGFREPVTFGKHMKKHDEAISGPCQCDICKIYFKNVRFIYKHMTSSHLQKFTCQVCDFSCFSRTQALMHYKWHKNVTYTCQYCKKEFNKASTHLTHIRLKHPSTFVCTMCGHSFVSESGLYCHKKIAHTQEEIEANSQVAADPASELYCGECALQFSSEAAYDTHLGSSAKHSTVNVSGMAMAPKYNPNSKRRSRGRPRIEGSDVINMGVATGTNCDICMKFLPNDVQARAHYTSEHPGADYLKRYMCDVCGHTTRLYANLMVHMRKHTREQPYACGYCDRRFSMLSNRDRHLSVHTGEKRYECQHCNRRFSQSSAMKLHVQTVHLKIPYPPWNKKNRKKRKDIETSLASVSQKLPDNAQGEYINAYMYNL